MEDRAGGEEAAPKKVTILHKAPSQFNPPATSCGQWPSVQVGAPAHIARLLLDVNLNHPGQPLFVDLIKNYVTLLPLSSSLAD